MALEDLDDDGYNDLVIARYRNATTQNTNSWVYWGSASGYSSSAVDSLPTKGAHGVAVHDLDQDGYPDIVFGNYYTGSSYQADTYIYWGSASGYSSSDRDDLTTYGTWAEPKIAGPVDTGL